MTLFTRSCHGPNGRFTLSCAGSVFGTQLMPYFVNSASVVSNNVIRRYIRVMFKVKVNLGQSSCYFDLRSNFQLDLPRSKSICFDASWGEEHDGAWIIPLSFLVRKLFAKNHKSSNRYLFFFDPTWRGQDMTLYTRWMYARYVCMQDMTLVSNFMILSQPVTSEVRSNTQI